ncbi:hypothetical protein BJ741DRAFT_672154 [Chytriomyces cf. hyalinus JEL632]|nr:hypothetical protein BJ741DRAFT_672154 [Chytriomyces cf. hyalinus JEL632]
MSGSKTRNAEDTLSITVSEKRVKLSIKVDEEAAVEKPAILFEDNSNNLDLLMDVAESKILSLEISDETAADVDPYPLPFFFRRVYKPSPLFMSVFMDETLITRSTEVLSTNTLLSLDKCHKTGIWKSEHSRELRRYGKREAARILELEREADLARFAAELEESLFSEMDID